MIILANDVDSGLPGMPTLFKGQGLTIGACEGNLDSDAHQDVKQMN